MFSSMLPLGSKALGQSGSSYGELVLPHTCLCYKGPPYSLSWACSPFSEGHLKRCLHLHACLTSIPPHLCWANAFGAPDLVQISKLKAFWDFQREMICPFQKDTALAKHVAPTIWDCLLKDWREQIYVWMPEFTARVYSPQGQRFGFGDFHIIYCT